MDLIQNIRLSFVGIFSTVTVYSGKSYFCLDNYCQLGELCQFAHGEHQLRGVEEVIYIKIIAPLFIAQSIS